MRGTQPSLPQQQALHRHLHWWSCQKISPVLLTSVTHHPCQPCQMFGGSQYLPHPTASGSPQGWSSQIARWGALVAEANEHGPRAAAHHQATMDSHCRELELNTKLAMHMNEAQAIEAMKEAEVSHNSWDQGGWGAPCSWDQGGQGVPHSQDQGRLRCATQPQSKKWSCTA